MSIQQTSVLCVQPHVNWRRYLRGIMIEPNLALNETAAEFFSRIDGRRSLADIADELLEHYDAEKTVLLEDLQTIAGELQEMNIVALDSDG